MSQTASSMKQQNEIRHGRPASRLSGADPRCTSYRFFSLNNAKEIRLVQKVACCGPRACFKPAASAGRSMETD